MIFRFKIDFLFSLAKSIWKFKINSETENQQLLIRSDGLMISPKFNINEPISAPYINVGNKPKIAILGLNPHCESNSLVSEEDKIIKPALMYLKSKKIDISGLFSADTFFLKENYKKYNLVIGMYHDQVLTPAKTLFHFNAINITIGLPFIRISPDHGPNESMVSKNISNPLSLIKSIDFFRRINAI